MNIVTKIQLSEARFHNVLKYSFVIKYHNLLLKRWVSSLLLPTQFLDNSCKLCSLSNSICKMGMKPTNRKYKSINEFLRVPKTNNAKRKNQYIFRQKCCKKISCRKILKTTFKQKPSLRLSLDFYFESSQKKKFHLFLFHQHCH